MRALKSPKSTRGVAYCNLLIFLALVSSISAQSKNSEPTEDSCRNFTQEFYDWYLPNTHVKAVKQHHESALVFALENRRSAFVPELARQLEHGEAEAKSQGEVFLDFDPVLNSQDPAAHYAVEKVSVKDGRCWADIYGTWPKMAKSEKPNVVPELIFRSGQWLFKDFHYPDSEHPDSASLLHILKSLHKSEEGRPE